MYDQFIMEHSFVSDRHELVRVTHIVDPCHFFVLRIADLDQLRLISNAINVICEHSDDPNDLFFEVQVGRYLM